MKTIQQKIISLVNQLVIDGMTIEAAISACMLCDKYANHLRSDLTSGESLAVFNEVKRRQPQSIVRAA